MTAALGAARSRANIVRRNMLGLLESPTRSVPCRSAEPPDQLLVAAMRRTVGRGTGEASAKNPPLHLQGRGTARSAVEGLAESEGPLHHAAHGPPPPENPGEDWSLPVPAVA